MREPICVLKDRNLEFFTYLGSVDGEFDPQINWESSEAGWFSLDKLPTPLHFGVRSLMRDMREQVRKEIERLW